MKTFNYSLLLLLAAMVAFSCTSRKIKEQSNELTLENQRLKKEASAKDSVINAMFKSFNIIEENLTEITSREQIIAQSTADEKNLSEDIREKIMEEIQTINNLMEENRNRISDLKNQLKKSNLKIKSLEETIALMGQRLGEKDQEILALKDQLMQLNFTVESLNAVIDTLQKENAQKSEMISQQQTEIDELNIVWYVVGPRKVLLEKNIIEKDGRFLSNNNKLNDLIKTCNCTRADVMELKEIRINAEKAEFVTVHPQGSYRFNMKDKLFVSLEITNPDEFWRASKFLVIQTK